jgi:glucosamine--fructose-6-phosphate aminotransferase (isomerizing)
MCGIVGYIGRDDAASVLTPALKRLEYRGYDSAGIATLNGHGIEVCKSLGKIAALEQRILSARPTGRMGIAHTRWATHGRPSDANAHPHIDCTGGVAVVHNGIIENYRALRGSLERDGHAFRSETDTEVIAHLIEAERRRGTGLIDAVRAAARGLRGSYALACIAEDTPDTIVAVRAGTSPLLVAMQGDEAYLASDAPALIGRCTATIPLEDGDMAVLTSGALAIRRLSGEPVDRRAVPLTADTRAVEKDGYRDYMLKEIFEQPDVISRAWRARLEPIGRGVKLAAGPVAERELADIERVVFLACGTSRHAGMLGEYLIEHFAGIPGEAVIASECRHRPLVYDKRVLAVAISQSGETADTLAALRQARAAGARTLAISNAPHSSLARESDGMLDVLAGHEIGVAATKSFTAQLTAVLWLALKLGAAKGQVDSKHLAEVVQAVCRAPRLMRDLLRQSDRIRTLAGRFVNLQSCLYLGRGLQYPLALEGALKLKEISYIHAEGCAAGEMKHGPIALVDPDTLVVALAPSGPTIDSMATAVQEVKARDGVVLALVTQGERAAADLADLTIEIPPAPVWIQPLLLSVPLQLFAYHLAVLRGCDVDQPRNLAKSVTVE